MSLPASVGTCRVDLRLIQARVDGADSDRDPDGIALPGALITFTASVATVRVANASPPVLISMAPFQCSTDSTGRLISPDGQVGVYLVASDDPDLDPHGWTYTVRVTHPTMPTVETTFVAPAGGELDLATLIPVPPSPGTAILQWQEVVDQAVIEKDLAEIARAAAEAAAADASAAVASINPAVPATPNTVARRTSSGAVAVGAATAPEHALNLATAENTFAKTEPRDINLRELGVNPTNSAAVNSTRIAQAVTNAPTGSRLLLPYHPSPVQIAGPIVVNKALHFVGLGGLTPVVQTTAGVPVFDLLDASGSSVDSFDLECSAPRPLTLPSTRGDNGRAYGAAVWVGCNRIRVSRLRVKNFVAGVSLVNWSTTTNTRTGTITDFVVDDMYIDDVDFGVLATSCVDVVIANVRGRYTLTSGSGDPSHLIYLTEGVGSVPARNVTVRDCVATDGSGGHAYQFKSVDGLNAANLTARGCSGLLSLRAVTNAEFRGLLSAEDTTAGTNGSIYMQGVGETDITLADVTLRMVNPVRAIRLDGTRTVLKDTRVFLTHTAFVDAADILAAGTNNRLENVQVINSGPGATTGGRAITVSGTSTGIVVQGGFAVNARSFVNTSSGATNVTVEYDPKLTTPATGSPGGFRVVSVSAALAQSRVRPARTLETFTTAGGSVAVRADQVTHAIVNVTGSGNVTVALTEPFPGATITYVVTNTTAAAMGTVTWTGHTLAAPFVSPAAGASATITFVHDGTGWRETSRA